MGRVLISAGHTVMDPGQVYQDLREADLTRKIAPKIIPYIEKAGVEVKGVPLDLPLLQRLEWINNTGYTDAAGDICVEVHVNDGNKRGIEGWFLGEGGNNSQKLAHTLIETITAETGYPSQGIHPEHEHELRSLTFLNRSNPAAVLLETLYIDNEEDIKLLKDDTKLEELAKAIAKGILKFLGKDMEGKDLAEDQKPKYDDLKPVPKPATPGTGELEMPEDLDDIFGDMGAGFNPALPDSTTAPSDLSLPATSAPVIPSPTPAMPTPGFSPAGAGFGAGGSFGGGSVPGLGGGSANSMMDREQRKEMIKANYIKMLGREPTQSDINYFLNQGINETDLVKKIADSQEHVDIVKGKQKLEETEKELETTKSELVKAKSKIEENSGLMENLQQLLVHKNKAISELEAAVFSKHGMPSSVVASSAQAPAAAAAITAKPPQNWHERLFRTLSERFSK